ncbi:MAG: hypothetical protein AAFW00_08245 [Bacteroidota bacterium]
MKRLIGILSFCVFLTSISFAQNSMVEVERQLKTLAEDILNHPDLEHKKTQNKKFSRLLIETLKRPESYTYDFDSLRTVSVLAAEDKTFRIFTWQIENRKDPNQYYGETRHYFFGLVQRKYVNENRETEYIVIPLIEMQEIPKGVENMLLDNTNWLGGLYYAPKYGPEIPKETMKYYDPRQRTSKGAVKRVKSDYYILMGWNGMDETSNMKFVDVMTFDPKDKNKVIFGVNVFYFDPIYAKNRALFRYSEYAPFSLNMGYIKKGPFNWNAKRVIVYDHLGTPKAGQQKLTTIWEMGPDGSYDALEFKSGGFFEWRKNVEVVSRLTNQELKASAENQQKILRGRLAEIKRLAKVYGDEEMMASIEEIEKKPSLGKKTARFIRQQEKTLAQRQDEMSQREKDRLNDAGINLSKKDGKKK